MATEADHIALANRNHEVLLYLLEEVDRFPEWVAVTAFYKAVQIVEAILVRTSGRCSHGHQKRLDSLKSAGYEELHKNYRALWLASSIARYLVDTAPSHAQYQRFSDYLPAEDVKRKLVQKRLYNVKCAAVGLLSDAGKATLVRLPKALSDPSP